MDAALLDPAAQELRAKLEEAFARIAQLEQRNSLLSERIRLLLIKKYGPGAERLSDGQLSLLELEPGVSSAEVTAEASPDQKLKDAEPKAPAKKPVRGPLPAHLPRIERLVCVPAGECFCGQCGGAKKLIGYETSERLAIKPVELYVEVTKREKRACAKCEEMGVSTAPVPPSIIEKGILADSLVVDVMIKKYCGHSPLYRQQAGLLRDAAVEVSQATLGSAVLKAGQLLTAVSEVMGKDLLAGGYIQADETTCPVQSNRTKGKNHQAYLWEYGRPGGPVVYDFRMGREREGPAAFLSDFNGLLQCDGYSAYDKIGGPNIVYFGCWAHARRKFFDASKADPKDARSVAVIVKIGKLYDVERTAREEGLDAAQREALRAELCPALFAEIKAMIIAARPFGTPKSALGKACTYALNQWERLVRYTAEGHGRVEIDNNQAENGMRGIALGRRNWIHVGSEGAGAKIAAILSVLETCKRLKINPRHYLEDVLPQLAYRDTRPEVAAVTTIEALTPAAWQHTRANAPQIPLQ